MHLCTDDHTDRVAALIETRLPLTVESEGHEDEWGLIGPALLGASTRHLRALEYLQTDFPSGVIGWQLLRALFEYVTTFAWIAFDPATRSQRWLESDYRQRIILDDDLAALGEGSRSGPAGDGTVGLLPGRAWMMVITET